MLEKYEEAEEELKQEYEKKIRSLTFENERIKKSRSENYIAVIKFLLVLIVDMVCKAQYVFRTKM